MKQNPEIRRIQEKLLPGKISAHGFLGDDTRNFTEIIAEDNTAIEELGLTHTAVAEKMRYFTEKGKIGLGNPVLVDRIFLVTVEDYRGILPCPFSDNVRADKRNTRVTNTKTQKSIEWTDLNIHMIEKHGFYEGKGAFFRVDPLRIADVLDMPGAQ